MAGPSLKRSPFYESLARNAKLSFPTGGAREMGRREALCRLMLIHIDRTS